MKSKNTTSIRSLSVRFVGGVELMNSVTGKKGGAWCSISSPTPGHDCNNIRTTPGNDVILRSTYVGCHISQSQLLIGMLIVHRFLRSLPLRHFPQPSHISRVYTPFTIKLFLPSFKYRPSCEIVLLIQRWKDLLRDPKRYVRDKQKFIRKRWRRESVIPGKRTSIDVKSLGFRVNDYNIRYSGTRVVYGENSGNGLFNQLETALLVGQIQNIPCLHRETTLTRLMGTEH